MIGKFVEVMEKEFLNRDIRFRFTLKLSLHGQALREFCFCGREKGRFFWTFEILSKQEHDHAVGAQTSMDILIQDLHNAHKEVAELRQTIQLLQGENARMADQLYGSHVDERFDAQSEDNQMEP